MSMASVVSVNYSCSKGDADICLRQCSSPSCGEIDIFFPRGYGKERKGILDWEQQQFSSNSGFLIPWKGVLPELEENCCRLPHTHAPSQSRSLMAPKQACE